MDPKVIQSWEEVGNRISNPFLCILFIFQVQLLFVQIRENSSVFIIHCCASELVCKDLVEFLWSRIRPPERSPSWRWSWTDVTDAVPSEPQTWFVLCMCQKGPFISMPFTIKVLDCLVLLQWRKRFMNKLDAELLCIWMIKIRMFWFSWIWKRKSIF